MLPKSTLLLPPRNLASCILVGIHRDTRGTKLPDRDRVNHFPASPIVAVTRVLHGDLFLLPTLSDAPPADKPSTALQIICYGPTRRTRFQLVALHRHRIYSQLLL